MKRKKKSYRKLTPKQKRFVQEYLTSGNATKAAIKAGYSKNTAGQIGEQNLKKLEIKKAIEAAQQKTSDRNEGLRDAVIEEIKLIGFSKMSDFVEWKTVNGKTTVTLVDSKKLTEAQKSCISEISQTKTKEGGTVRFKLHSKTDALGNLCRHLGLYAPKKIEFTRDLKEMTDAELDAELDALEVDE